MQYQTFRAPDVKEALSLVKATFGANAIIGATRSVPERGKMRGEAYVEVSAAPPKDREQAHARAPERAASRPRNPSPLPSSTPNRAVERELQMLRAMVDELASGRSAQSRLEATLRRLGIEGLLARRLASSAEPEIGQTQEALSASLKRSIMTSLTFGDSPIEQDGPRMITCIGPSGAGKTTTLAKLAARAKIEGRRSVSVVTLDTFRVGAVAQWQRYAQLLGIPMGVAHDAQSFERMLKEHATDLVLVDTAGRSSDRAWQDPRVLECLARVNVPIDVLMVLPAWLRARDVERVMQVYAAPPASGLVITKLDETDCIGGALHAALDDGLPITYLCNGPRVPEDIQIATPDRVSSALFQED